MSGSACIATSKLFAKVGCSFKNSASLDCASFAPSVSPAFTFAWQSCARAATSALTSRGTSLIASENAALTAC